MQYLIKTLEQKEYEGRKYATAFVKALDGTELTVSFGDKWGEKLATLEAGQSVEANPWQNPKNSKWSLYPIEDKKPSSGANYPNKTASITKAMDRKEKSIGRFQDDKEFSIMVSSTMRDAVQLAIAEIKDITTLNTLEQDILKWRNWLITHWQIDEKDVPPFN